MFTSFNTRYIKMLHTKDENFYEKKITNFPSQLRLTVTVNIPSRLPYLQFDFLSTQFDGFDFKIDAYR